MKKLIKLMIISISFLFSVEVTLKNGVVYNGEIITQNNEELILKTESGELKFPTNIIESIELSKKSDSTFNPNTGLMIVNYSKDDISNFARVDFNNYFNLNRKVKWSVLGGGLSLLSIYPGIIIPTYFFNRDKFPSDKQSTNDDIIIFPAVLGSVVAPYLTYLYLPKIFNNIPKNENYNYFSKDNQNYYNELLNDKSINLKRKLIRNGILYWIGFMFIVAILGEDGDASVYCNPQASLPCP